MKAKDLIKEIDPDYQRCSFCKRLFHISKLIRKTFYSPPKVMYSCLDGVGCSNQLKIDGKHS